MNQSLEDAPCLILPQCEKQASLRIQTEEGYYGVASWQGSQIEGSQQGAFPVRQDALQF